MMEKLDSFARIFTKFALLNILWLFFTVLGLGVLGLFPATVAMFSISRKWIQGDRDIPVVKTFWTMFKSNFMKANIYGWMIALAGVVLYVNYLIIVAAGTETPIFVVIAFILVVISYLLMIVSVIPVSIHFEGNGREILRKTSMFVLGRIHIALLFLLIVWTVGYMSLALPVFILFFSGSVLSYIMMWFFTQTLEKFEKKQALQMTERV
ncbi:hypothetical protein CR203_07025 [Salipaludibacillus neizhouensis]|uniref:DUF624 domain-containing protein n=1 Tax=Salipaludibacillus neizhouensis TaxID=885475 RepID=A0A3A9KCK5_9BACI|nr:DUF624 domain-containing protein [Salipaludibacillus neizhouensis]RKL68231.1 hypothetical protein CR203_07025 [Salipaludibacillus neizhouensis]